MILFHVNFSTQKNFFSRMSLPIMSQNAIFFVKSKEIFFVAKQIFVVPHAMSFKLIVLISFFLLRFEKHYEQKTIMQFMIEN